MQNYKIRCIFILFLTLSGKKIAHQRSTFIGQHAGDNHSLGMKRRLRHNRRIAPLRIRRSYHYAPYLAPPDSAGTHDTRFYGDV